MKAILLILKGLLVTIRRFPMPITAGLLSFVFLVIELHFGHQNETVIHDYRFVKLFLECLSGISLFIACDIFSESQHVELSRRIGLYLLGFCVLGMHYYSITPGMFDSETVFISRYLIFAVCFHLLISFVAFYKSSAIDSFWQYNYFLFKRIATALLYSSTLFIGLASALWALDKLFSILIPSDYYIDLLAFIFLVFNTIFFLKGFPVSYQAFASNKEFKKSIRLFVQYVLLPIVGIYISLLYLYMFKIIFEQHLPNGWVCVPILIFSIIGILAYLLVYPIRLQASNRLIYLFSKYFFYILLPLLSLYFIAIAKRIMPYGITEDRYLVLILGLWLVIISIYIISSKKDNIIVVPVSLFMLLAVSAIGPWGMFQLSIENQLVRLERLLKRNHLLEDGKLVELRKGLSVSEKDAASIRSIFSYLNKRGEIDRIHPWLAEKDQAKLDSVIKRNDLYYIYSIFPDLEASSLNPYELHHYFMADQNRLYKNSLNIEGYKRLTHFSVNMNEPGNLAGSDSSIHCSIFNDTMVIQADSQEPIVFSLKSKFQSLLKYEQQRDSIIKAGNKMKGNLQVFDESSQRINMPVDSMKLIVDQKKLIFSSIEFIRSDSISTLISVEGYLLD